jgi:hypothetical protein
MGVEEIIFHEAFPKLFSSIMPQAPVGSASAVRQDATGQRVTLCTPPLLL